MEEIKTLLDMIRHIHGYTDGPTVTLVVNRRERDDLLQTLADWYAELVGEGHDALSAELDVIQHVRVLLGGEPVEFQGPHKAVEAVDETPY